MIKRLRRSAFSGEARRRRRRRKRRDARSEGLRESGNERM